MELYPYFTSLHVYLCNAPKIDAYLYGKCRSQIRVTNHIANIFCAFFTWVTFRDKHDHMTASAPDNFTAAKMG